MNMMRNLFGGQGSSLPGPLGNIANLIQKFKQFSQNPVGALIGMGANIPQNISNNPEATVNYLRNSGQMTDQQFNEFSNLANQFQNFLPKKF